jgi:hypothetical protein
MPRFVILEHDHPSLHWDLMVETGEMLRTWRLPAPPSGGASLLAKPIFDHRRVYLDYEGPLSCGRGRVVRWDGGEYEVVTWSEEEIRLRLEGKRIRGLFLLHRESADRWRAFLEPERAPAAPEA